MARFAESLPKTPGYGLRGFRGWGASLVDSALKGDTVAAEIDQ
jgi:hypothetical protein